MDNQKANCPPSPSWQSVTVALALIIAITVIFITAMIRYPAVDEAMKVWAGLTGIVGVIVGAMGTYFFTRGSVQAATQAMTSQMEQTKKEASDDKKRANLLKNAMIQTAGKMPPDEWSAFMSKSPALQEALNGDAI